MVRRAWNKIDGYKTYIVAAVAVAYALTQLWSGAVTPEQAVTMVLAALGLGSLRHGVSKLN